MGEDLHSTTSELLYGKKWKEAAEENCAYYHQGHQKCECKKHKDMRYKIKRVNYGLAYGMTEIKLAGELGITRDEAKALMQQYFKTFPKIKRLLDLLGRFGVQNGFSMTMAPFFRRRYYAEWEYIEPEIIDGYIREIGYDKSISEIERASKNVPIQGSAADQIKLSSVMIRRYIRDNNLQDYIKFVLQIHDENVFVVHPDYAEMWKDKSKELMEEAAKISIPSGLLKADAQVSDYWTK